MLKLWMAWAMMGDEGYRSHINHLVSVRDHLVAQVEVTASPPLCLLFLQRPYQSFDTSAESKHFSALLCLLFLQRPYQSFDTSAESKIPALLFVSFFCKAPLRSTPPPQSLGALAFARASRAVHFVVIFDRRRHHKELP